MYDLGKMDSVHTLPGTGSFRSIGPTAIQGG